MSNLFNYELDEIRIRTTLQSTESFCCENTWQAFENLFSKEMHRQPVQESKQPKVKFEINYRTLTPALFFGAVVCSSVILFKVIRFNKDGETTASASGKTNISKASLLPAISSAKETAAKQLHLVTHESAATITVSSMPAKAQTLPAVEVKTAETSAAPAPVVEATATVPAATTAKPVYKAKRKPAAETEAMETIPSMKPTTVSSANDEKEPELDLK